MIPDFNNVYGHVAPHGLDAVLRAVRPLAAGGRAWIKVSGDDGARTPHPEAEPLDFRTTPLGEGRHRFNGGVGGTAGEVIALVESLSRVLSAAGIEHPFEVYDEDQSLQQLVPAVPGATPHDHPAFLRRLSRLLGGRRVNLPDRPSGRSSSPARTPAACRPQPPWRC